MSRMRSVHGPATTFVSKNQSVHLIGRVLLQLYLYSFLVTGQSSNFPSLSFIALRCIVCHHKKSFFHSHSYKASKLENYISSNCFAEIAVSQADEFDID